MTNTKRQIPPHSHHNKTARQSKAAPKKAGRATVRVPHAPVTASQRQRSLSRQPGRPQSKQARIIAMHRPAQQSMQ